MAGCQIGVQKVDVGCDVSELAEKNQQSNAGSDVSAEELNRVAELDATGSDRRRIFLGLGAAVASLAGCADETIPTHPVAKTPATTTTGSTGNVSTPNAQGGDSTVTNTPAPDSSTLGISAIPAEAMFKVLSAANAQFIVLDEPMMGAGSAPYVTMSDGKKILVWSLVEAATKLGFNGTLITPGPVLEMIEGKPAAVTLTTMMGHTMHWHGMDVPTPVDGDPDTSGWVGGMMRPAGVSATARSLGTSFTYGFTAPHAGTYFYHCHIDTVVHMEMGMMGAVVVRPPGGSASQLYANGPSFDKEYIWQLHTVDSTWHKAGHFASGSNNVRYRPNYFMINGMEGPNLLSDSTVAITATVGQTVLIRLVNFGYLTAVVSLGGLKFVVAASDGRPLNQDLRVDKLVLGAGERYDILIEAAAAASRAPQVQYFNAMGTKVLGKAVTSLVIA